MGRVKVIIISALFLHVAVCPASAIHKTIPAETESTHADELTTQTSAPRQSSYNKLQALINLLTNKGIISEEELKREIKKLNEMK